MASQVLYLDDQVRSSLEEIKFMEEYIDIINKETGENTGEKKLKSEVHRDGLWHKTAHIWCINSKKEILLQHRSKDKKNFPNMWDISVAGYISSGEDSKTGAIREIKEEIERIVLEAYGA